jgi:glyoxylase-like metal-dependent hydrolase (beta-lactamase superfamily II)
VLNGAVEELADGIRRVTMPLPTRPGHVHAYLLPADDGWTLVDTGLGLPDATERWRAELGELAGEVRRIVITHFHPDHVGAAADVAALTGAEVFEGELDYEQCRLVWGDPGWPERIAGWFRENGVPAPVTDELLGTASAYAAFIRYADSPTPIAEGASVDGWDVLAFPGHADGQLCLNRDGVLVAADHVLQPISPAVGLYPQSRPDPLGDYLASLERVIELEPRVALPGHGEPIPNPAERARELIRHHRERLRRTAAALGDEPRTGYDVSLALFGLDLKPAARRFAVAESLSHLERLVVEGGAERDGDGGAISYTPA